MSEERIFGPKAQDCAAGRVQSSGGESCDHAVVVPTLTEAGYVYVCESCGGEVPVTPTSKPFDAGPLRRQWTQKVKPVGDELDLTWVKTRLGLRLPIWHEAASELVAEIERLRCERDAMRSHAENCDMDEDCSCD